MTLLFAVLAVIVVLAWLALRELKSTQATSFPISGGTATPAPFTTPAAVPGATTTAIAPKLPAPIGPSPTPLNLPGPDVSSARRPTKIRSRKDLIELFWWMIHSGTDAANLDALSISRDEIAETANKFSSYFEKCSYSTAPLCIKVTFKAGVAMLHAIENGTTDRLSEADLAIAVRAKAIVDELIRPGMTDLEKELAVYNYVAAHCEYPAIINSDDGSARGFFLNGLCRCAGYVDTFRLLGRLAGLEVETIGGTTTRDLPGNKGHAWNLVRLDGLWYAVDVTWDDMLGGASNEEHAFFNLPYAVFGGSRFADPACCPPGDYAAAVDANYYFYRDRYMAETVDEALDIVARQLGKKRRTAYVWFTGEDLSKTVAAALKERYGTTVRTTALTEDLKLNIYRFLV